MRGDEFERLRSALVRSVLDCEGSAAPDLRRRAFSNSGLPSPLDATIDKVVKNSHALRDADIEALKRTGTSEEQIFELVICAAIGEASRRYEAAADALNGDSQ